MTSGLGNMQVLDSAMNPFPTTPQTSQRPVNNSTTPPTKPRENSRVGTAAREATTTQGGGREKNLAHLRHNNKSTKRSWDDLTIPQRTFFILDRGGFPDVDAPWIFNQLRSFIVRLNVILTLVQTGAIVLAYEPQNYEGGRNSTYFAVNVVCTMMFTIDLVARIACAPNPKAYACTPLNFFEFIGLIPFWIDIQGTIFPAVSQFLLLLRVLRLIRWLLYLEMFEVIASTIEESSEVVAMFLLIVSITLPVIGTTSYYAERGTTYNRTDGSEVWVRPCDVTSPCAFEDSPYQHASDGMWQAMTTVTSIGFGDATPNSALGKFLIGFCMVISVMVVAFPVMVLSVNFAQETERIRVRNIHNSGKRSAQLSKMQQEYAKLIDFEAKKARKSFMHRDSIAFGDPTAMLLIPTRAKPIYFKTPEDGTFREAMLFTATEIRYDPLMTLKRDHRGVVVLDQNRKKKTEFRFTVLLGSAEASKKCQEVMTGLLPVGSPRIARCRHFHVTRVNFGLDVPADRGDFMRSIRLLRPFDDQIESNRLQVDGTLELYGLQNIDENHTAEVSACLARCRLHIIASVVRSDPLHYEIPFFYDMLKATPLAHAISSRKRKTGLVYCTEKQVINLVNGIHSIFRIPLHSETDEEVQILNVDEINRTITGAILRECAVEVGRPDTERMDAFLLPVFEERDPETNKANVYYGLIPYKLLGRSEKTAYLDAMFGFALGTKNKEDELEAKLSKMLCSVIVKAARVRQMHLVEQF